MSDPWARARDAAELTRLRAAINTLTERSAAQAREIERLIAALEKARLYVKCCDTIALSLKVDRGSSVDLLVEIDALLAELSEPPAALAPHPLPDPLSAGEKP